MKKHQHQLLFYCHNKDTKQVAVSISLLKNNLKTFSRMLHFLNKQYQQFNCPSGPPYDSETLWTQKYRLNELATINRPRTKEHVLTKKWQGEKWFQVTLSTWPLNRHTRWFSCGFLQSYSTADLWGKGIGDLKENKQKKQGRTLYEVCFTTGIYRRSV